MQESPPVSTTEASSASSALSLPAIVCIVGGALSVIASFLPWANVSADLSSLGLAKFSQNVNGMDGDGMITLIFGIALIVVGGLLFGLKGRGITALGIIGALAGLIAAGTAIYDISTVKSTTISDFAGSTAASAGIPVAQAQQLLERFHFSISVSFGLVLAAIGGLVGIVGSIIALGRRSAVTPPMAAPTYSASPAMPPPPPAGAPTMPPAQPDEPAPPSV